MMNGPLNDPRLQAIEAALDSDRLDQAERLLAELDDVSLERQATSYLTTRLLFQRGRLSVDEVAVRMRQILRSLHDFPQAKALLDAAQGRTLSSRGPVSKDAAQPSSPHYTANIPGPPGLPQFARTEPDFPSPSQVAPAQGFTRDLHVGFDSEPATQPDRGESPASEPTPSIFSVLTLLDEQRYAEALTALNSSAKDVPELTLMRARAYLGLNQREAARAALDQLCQDRTLGPELRAGGARLLIEAGEAELALEQAEAAFAVAHDSPAVVLTTAWTLLRVARRDQDEQKRNAATELLNRLDALGGSSPALAQALRACILAETGHPQQALATARHAAELDPAALDALVAETLAHAALGHREELAATWRKLLTRDQDEARSLRPMLAKLGAELDRLSPSLVPSSAEPVSRRIWSPLEAALLGGEREALLQAFEEECQNVVSTQCQEGQSAFTDLGRLAARCLGRMPGFCHFAPYDLSLFSVLRLQIALDVVCGHEPLKLPFDNARLLLGAYLGEAIRHSYAGTWCGTLATLDRAQVAVTPATLLPFGALDARLFRAMPLELGEFLPLERAHATELEWSRRMDPDDAPPTPWAPDPWPALPEVGTLGRALSRSVVSLYCEQFAEATLDHTRQGLPALDSYLTLIAPPWARSVLTSPVLTRVSVLIGAYVGEVVRHLVGGHWRTGEGTGAASFALQVGDMTLYPIQQVLERVSGQTQQSVTEYVQRLGRDLGF